MNAVTRLLFIGFLFILTAPTRGVVKLSTGTLTISGGTTLSDLGDAPTITSARGRTVRVQMPAGYEQVIIERLVKARPAKWATYAQTAAPIEGGEVTIQLRKAIPQRFLRAVGRKATSSPLQPGGVITGRPSTFSPPADLSSGDSSFTLGSGTTASGLSLSGDYSTNGTGGTSTVSRVVAESDIWKLHGDRLYVFNPYRGLQVLDLANPAVPLLLGSLYFPDAGEALYLVGDNHVALLTKRDVTFTWDYDPQTTGSLVICDVSTGKPGIVATIPLDGKLVESRLVGTALYVATSSRSATTFREMTSVTGYDLSDPAHPVKRNTVTVPPPATGYSNPGPVQASDRYFLVAQHRRVIGVASDYRSLVSLVDISSPDGTVVLRGNALAAGIVSDKFKMQERNGVLSLISSVQQLRNTQLENFDVTNAKLSALLGSLTLGQNETVRGTRFDGDRVYVVTFLQIDPLWIVDNSAPRAPVIVGHLEVPGFSTYIEPLGDRLVTIGLVNSRVSVSLFDVADPAAPSLLSQLPVSDAWTWSEATWNEKAFSVNPEAGLIMVPLTSTWSDWLWNPSSTTNGGIQLVDLEREQLRIRGRIDRNFTPRRAEFHRGTIVALSNADLLTADTTDRDHPAVLAEVQLAWKTLHAWPVGNHLLQVGADLSGENPVISVAPIDDPDGAITSVDLSPASVLAADLRDNLLYVVQADFRPTTTLALPRTTLTVFDVSSLPSVVKKGETTFAGVPAQYAENRILWPQPGTMVLSTLDQGSYGWLQPIFIIGDPMITVISLVREPEAQGNLSLANTTSASFAQNGLFCYPIPRTYAQQLYAFDVTDPAAPSFLNKTTFTPKRWGNLGELFAAGGKIFASARVDYPMTTFATLSVASTGSDLTIRPQFEFGKTYLYVVDYTDPAKPQVRAPISSPGELKGVTRNGTVLFTQGWEYDSAGNGISTNSFGVHASVYDGTKMELASQLSVPRGTRSLIDGETVFTFYNKATPETDGKLASYVSLWDVQPDLQFVERDSILFAGYNERAIDGVLLSTTYLASGSAIAAVDFSNHADLKRIGWISMPYLNNELSKATGDRTNGIWIPLGEFGAFKLELPAK